MINPPKAGLGAVLALAAAFPVLAQQPKLPTGSALVRAVGDCRAIAEDARRLACYDAAAGRLETAERTGEVVVVDREQARAARRQAFGFQLPSLDMFNRAEDPGLDEVATTLSSASVDGNGKWVLRTADSQVWRQIDNNRLNPRPRNGAKVEIRRALLGSFFMNVDGGRAIRVRREQ